MKVGIDITCLSSGRGPARYTTEIVRALSEVCSIDDLFFLYSPFEIGIAALPSNFIIRHLPLQKRRPWLNWTLPLAVRRDKVEVMFFPANDFWLWKAAPTVVVLHDIAPATELYQYLPTWKDKLQIKLQMKTLPFVSDKVLTVSKYSAKQIETYLPKLANRITVVYNGLTGFSQEPRDHVLYEKPYILFVGGFDRRKNLERLLEAFKVLISNGRNEKLVLVGSSGKNMNLYYVMPELVSSLGLNDFVEISNSIDDEELGRLYRGACLLVLPSTVEGFGLPVLEAMVSGCPVVASNAASIPEVGGDAAIYFDPYDISNMAECLNRVLSNEKLRNEMILRGIDQAKKFNWVKAGEQIYGTLAMIAKH